MLLAAACSSEENERAQLDLEVGRGSAGGVSFRSEGGLAAVMSAVPGAVTFWAQSPVIRISAATSGSALTDWTITIKNCMADAELSAETDEEGNLVSVKTQISSTEISWALTIPQNRSARIEIAPPDALVNGPFSFVVISDIQGSENADMYSMVNAEPGVRFVISAGDLTEGGGGGEFRSLKANFGRLDVPLFSTAGNHDTMNAGPDNWHNNIGRFNVHFRFRGAFFTLLDSSDATVEPMVYDWLKRWVSSASGSAHIFVTHYPPFDPFGLRSGSFSSSAEAAKLLAILGRGGVDVTFYGHVHRYYKFSNAGIPAYISGGGGGIQGIIDPYGRHYLVADVEGGSVRNVRKIMVD
jgi:predicted phosphodiesterase